MPSWGLSVTPTGRWSSALVVLGRETDKNDDGWLDRAELATMLDAVGMPKERIQSRLVPWDIWDSDPEQGQWHCSIYVLDVYVWHCFLQMQDILMQLLCFLLVSHCLLSMYISVKQSDVRQHNPVAVTWVGWLAGGWLVGWFVGCCHAKLVRAQEFSRVLGFWITAGL